MSEGRNLVERLMARGRAFDRVGRGTIDNAVAETTIELHETELPPAGALAHPDDVELAHPELPRLVRPDALDDPRSPAD